MFPSPWSQQYIVRFHPELLDLQYLLVIDLVGLVAQYIDVEMYDSSVPAQSYVFGSRKEIEDRLLLPFLSQRGNQMHGKRFIPPPYKFGDLLFLEKEEDDEKTCFWITYQGLIERNVDLCYPVLRIPRKITQHYRDITSKYQCAQDEPLKYTFPLDLSLRSDDLWIHKHVGVVPMAWTFGFEHFDESDARMIAVQFHPTQRRCKATDEKYWIPDARFTRPRLFNLFESTLVPRIVYEVKHQCDWLVLAEPEMEKTSQTLQNHFLQPPDFSFGCAWQEKGMGEYRKGEREFAYKSYIYYFPKQNEADFRKAIDSLASCFPKEWIKFDPQLRFQIQTLKLSPYNCWFHV